MATRNLSSYLAAITAGASQLEPFDAARYMAILAANSEGARNYIGQQAAVYQGANTQQQQQVLDPANLAAVQGIEDTGNTVQDNLQQTVDQNAAAGQGGDTPAGQQGALFQQQTAQAEQNNREAAYKNVVAGNNSVNNVQSNLQYVANAARDQVNSTESQGAFALMQKQNEDAAAAASGGRRGGGGGGGGGSGGGGGGGSSSGDALSAGDRGAYAALHEVADFRGDSGARKGAFGNQTGQVKGKDVKHKAPAFGEGARDFLFGVSGGAKGHVAPDLSNVDEVLKKQLAYIDKQRRAHGKAVGYTKASLIALANDVKKNVSAAQKDLGKRSIAYDKLAMLDNADQILGDEPHPKDVAAWQAAAARDPGPSKQQTADAWKRMAATEAGQQKTSDQARAGNMMPNQNLRPGGRSLPGVRPKGISDIAWLKLAQFQNSHPGRRGFAGKRPGKG